MLSGVENEEIVTKSCNNINNNYNKTIYDKNNGNDGDNDDYSSNYTEALT